ncbi:MULTISPECIES: MIP/aquaporin family protein [unclassified Nostoc]|uniref:MIP/aquaporin family protein n=1 Tax=unclassified Nostoc TaxID=2593658 RepID=UPI001C8AFAAF|nr:MULTISPECIES: aquaporin [unclassified Nostoc]
MMQTLRKHYPEYLMEAAGLGIFLISAVVVTTLLEHPASPIPQAISDPLLRRFIIGVAMGLIAICIIYSPWGKQSGAHLNPVVTFTFFRLGKIQPWDVIFYILAHFIGGLLGLLFTVVVFRDAVTNPSINYIVTIPGAGGAGVAFFAELVISFGVMLMILFASNTPKLSPFTGIFAGVMIATYITVEAPLSGTSMNPARTLASAIPSHNWTAIWVYFTAPLLGMLLAAELYIRLKGKRAVRCAKLHHHNNKRCIFRCGYRHPEVDKRWLLSDKLPNP